mgnify:CR=1 FL=1
MVRQQLGSEHIRKITKSGSGVYYVTIPIDVLRELGWREHQKLVVKKRGEGVLIQDWEKGD